MWVLLPLPPHPTHGPRAALLSSEGAATWAPDLTPQLKEAKNFRCQKTVPSKGQGFGKRCQIPSSPLALKAPGSHPSLTDPGRPRAAPCIGFLLHPEKYSLLRDSYSCRVSLGGRFQRPKPLKRLFPCFLLVPSPPCPVQIAAN